MKQISINAYQGFSHRSLLLPFFFGVLLYVQSGAWAADAPAKSASRPEAAPASLADPQALLHIRIHKPLQVLDNPWMLDLWKTLEASPTARQHMEAWQGGRLAEMRQFLERASGEPWKVGLEKLTAGGIEFALQKRPIAADSKQPYAALLVIHSSDGKLLHRFLTAADQERREKLGEEAGLLEKKSPSEKFPGKTGGAPQVSNYTYRKHHCTKVIKGHDRPGEYFAAVGRKFLFTTDEKLLEELINRCTDKTEATADHVSPSGSSAAKEVVVTPTTADEPLWSFSVRLDQMREFPQFRELLLPGSDPWMAPAIAYRDALRHAERLDGTLHVETGGVRLRLASHSLAAEVAPASSSPKLAANASANVALPLLRLPNTASSLSLNRDAAQLWRGRNEWLSPAGVQQVEEWNRLATSQIAGLDLLHGLDFLGSHWRIVLTVPPPLTDAERAARFKSEPRKSEPGKGDRERGRRSGRFPAAALIVELRDEPAFRREVLDRIESYFQTPAGLAIGKLETIEHHGIRIANLRLNPPPAPPETARGAAASEEPRREAGGSNPRRGGGLSGGPRHGRHRHHAFPTHRYFQPGCAIRNGQLLVGSTAEVLRQLIDELERQSSATPATRTASDLRGEQFLSLAKVADHFHSRSWLLQSRLLRTGEWTAEQAKQEVVTLEAALRQLGDLTWQETASDTSLQIDLRLGKPTR